MTYSTDPTGREDEIVDLVAATFTASEGADEGTLMGKLARDLLETPERDLIVSLAEAEDETGLAGVTFHTRLHYPGDDRVVFVMGPVAVAPAKQGQGVGLGLVRFGLDELATRGAHVALTYGNPAYYSRAGYLPITQEDIAAPYPLRFAFGWQGQSLSDAPLTPLKGPCTCVAGFADPAYW